MAEIKVLDQDTINQIAAGEVVERPASIVKELVENSIDARSSAITVEIKGGGIDFIRITDNGCGIGDSQVRTAFLSHATSKIVSASDLTTVSSLGFRGEALSSIAAVSKVEVITKTDEGISGIRYVTEGGEEVSYEVIGCPEGTTFLVRNLFYNTPARRKFLKSGMTEAGYVEAFIQRLAISHPDISFRFISDNKNKISTSGNGNLRDVIYHLYGRDIAANLLEVKAKEEDIEVTGYIGKPVICRGNRGYENYFVNGRYLKNNIITKAIEDGYKGHSMVHKFPFTALMIHMDPHSFDANVHPSKMEMRFHKGELLYTVISRAVRESFVKKELIPRMETEEKKGPGGQGLLNRVPEPFESRRKEIEEHFSNLSAEKIRAIQEEKKQDKEHKDNKENETGSAGNPDKHASLSEKLRRLNLDEKAEAKADIDKEMGVPRSGQARTGSSGQTSVVKEPDLYGTQMKLSDIPLFSDDMKPQYRLIGQVFRTYWLFEYEEKLYFVDQHAAHEKVMYEKMRKALREKKVSRQMLAPPIILSLNLRERQRLESCLEAFGELGYQLEEFGGNEYCIRAVPADLIDLDSRDLFVELLDHIDDNTGKMDMGVLTDKLASMACKAAVKGNMDLSFQEMESLMDQLMELENPYQCPHGRPTIISMTKRELEKKFHRIQ